MTKIELEENFERLSKETREAKQECLAFFASTMTFVEEMRQTNEDIHRLEADLKRIRSEPVINLKEWAAVSSLLRTTKSAAESMAMYIFVNEAPALEARLNVYRDRLAYFNQHATWLNEYGQVIEFRSDHRRSNRPSSP